MAHRRACESLMIYPREHLLTMNGQRYSETKVIDGASHTEEVVIKLDQKQKREKNSRIPDDVKFLGLLRERLENLGALDRAYTHLVSRCTLKPFISKTSQSCGVDDSPPRRCYSRD